MLVQQEQLPDSQRSTLHDWDSGGYMREALRSRFPTLDQLAAQLSHEVTHCSKNEKIIVSPVFHVQSLDVSTFHCREPANDGCGYHGIP